MKISLKWHFVSVSVDLSDLIIHIIQGYFSGIDTVIRLPRTSEMILKDMGKRDYDINTTKRKPRP